MKKRDQVYRLTKQVDTAILERNNWRSAYETSVLARRALSSKYSDLSKELDKALQDAKELRQSLRDRNDFISGLGRMVMFADGPAKGRELFLTKADIARGTYRVPYVKSLDSLDAVVRVLGTQEVTEVSFPYMTADYVIVEVKSPRAELCKWVAVEAF